MSLTSSLNKIIISDNFFLILFMVFVRDILYFCIYVYCYNLSQNQSFNYQYLNRYYYDIFIPQKCSIARDSKFIFELSRYEMIEHLTNCSLFM